MKINLKTTFLSICAIGFMTFAAQSLLFSEITIDEWYSSNSNQSPSSYQWFSPQYSFKVQPTQVSAAANELAAIKIKPVTQSEAEACIGKRVSISRKFKPYLVRGLLFNEQTGNFSLMRRGNDLLVTHASLGSSTRMQRQPLIVFLDWKPQNVFVEASMAE